MILVKGNSDLSLSFSTFTRVCVFLSPVIDYPCHVSERNKRMFVRWFEGCNYKRLSKPLNVPANNSIESYANILSQRSSNCWWHHINISLSEDPLKTLQSPTTKLQSSQTIVFTGETCTKVTCTDLVVAVLMTLSYATLLAFRHTVTPNGDNF